MTLNRIVSKLNPGDKFVYKDRMYLLVNTTPIDLGCSADTSNYLCAIDLNTYEIMCFDKDWEVNISGAESHSDLFIIAGNSFAEVVDCIYSVSGRKD